MAGHIRWTEDAALAVWSGYGHAGECGAQLFTIAAPLPGSDGGYLLMSRLPGMEDFGCSRPRLEDAQAEAERWLAQFAASLGAIFPAEAAADLRSYAAEMEGYADGGDEGRHDRSMFATGMRRAADLIEHGDQPAVNAAPDEPAKEGH